MTARLIVQNLWVRYPTPARVIEAVRGVSFILGREKLGIVGESGSGKSTVGRAILRLVPPPGEVTAERLVFDGIHLLSRRASGPARDPRPAHRDGDAGSQVLAQPGDDRRPPDPRGL